MVFLIRSIGTVALVASCLVVEAKANGGPVYQRQRNANAYVTLPRWGHDRRFIGNPYFHGGYYQQPVSGQWFARPYPYHFDIYRGRFNIPPAIQEDPRIQGLEPSPSIP